MKKRTLIVLAAVCVFIFLSVESRAALFDVHARENSSTGGSGAPTISLSDGQAFTVSVDPLDLWNAGALPRWSDANGLIEDLLATGSDESGQAAGTLIGKDWGLWTQNGFSAPYGALVGQIGSAYILLGTSYSGTAPSAGVLNLFYWDSYSSDNTENIQASVNVVPLPAAVWMLGAGLIGLVAIRRRSQR